MSNKQQVTDKAFQLGSDCGPGVATTGTQLPVVVSQKIWFEAEKYTEEKVKTINEEHFNVYNAYIAGATAYATKLHELKKEFDAEMQKNYVTIVAERAALNDAKALLEEIRIRHESGLLPDRFIYEKIKKFLHGE